MTDRRFPDVPSGYPFPRLERETLARWREGRIFEKSLEKPAPRGEWVFYEGPPTANNVPHVGHVSARVAKDLFPRYRTMRGHHVARKAGWDTHGLPVEIEVEKRLGFSGKQEIEAYGIAEFNRACLESVRTYEREWRAMTERMAYWTDLDHAYFTYSNQYVESVWWALSELRHRELLAKGYKIQPYCARCGTTLSSHEVAQNYKDVEDPSVWALFPARAGQELPTEDGGRWTVPPGESIEAGLALVAWTTTPWTLLAHVALVVHPELVYRVVADPRDPSGGRFLLFGDDLEQPVPLDAEVEGERKRLDLRDEPVVARVRGADLAGLRYDRPFRTTLGEWVDECDAQGRRYAGPTDESGFLVVAADYVTSTEGTGLVHTAPRFGEDDYKTGLAHGLPLLKTIDSEGRVVEMAGIERFAGLDFKEADPRILRDLKERGLLLHSEPYRHNYPFCWRCDRPLLYYATESWFVTTTAKQERLIELNRTIDWHPAHVGEGRFGNWLENMVDWALSRRRYWGTPLPVWECGGCPHTVVVGSYEELFRLAGRELPDDPYDPEQFDPHRPSIDEMTWGCPECGRRGEQAEMRRVEEVIDAWFDSGSMPYAQHHYPFENRETFERQFPADLIAEGVDQTRGWFYTLHALAGLLFDSVAYRNCVVLGHINDEQGRKMSKRLGNVVDPMAVMEETGADALRWYLCVSNPELSSRFSARLVRESAQRYLLPIWNALSFFTIYANLDGWRPTDARTDASGRGRLPFAGRPALDRWVLLRLDRIAEAATEALEGFRIADGARAIEAFVDDLTNWYVRRSRGRFWSAGAADTDDKESAYQTLYEVLTTLARLTAPFTPFVADELHGRLERSQGRGAESIHLEAWPEPGERAEAELERAMAAVQKIARLGHAARNAHGLKTRQPLASVTLVAADPELPAAIEPYAEIVRDELNVQGIVWAERRADYVRHEVKPDFRKTGPRFGKRMKEVAAALGRADGDELAAAVERDGKIALELSDGPVELSADEVEVRLVEREGIAAQGDRELLVALDTALTPELVAEGLAREVVNRVQTARKEADLDYADRIRVRYRAGGELARAIETHRDWIARETLAVELALVEDGAGDLRPAPVEDHPFALEISTISN